MPSRKEHDDGQTMTVGGVARRLGCAEATVRRMADARLIPCARDSAGRRVFNLAAVTQALTARGR